MELRPATAEESDAFSVAVLTAFHEELTDELRKRYLKIDEPERSLAWFDEGSIVGTSGLFSRAITVPGGAQVPFAAVTAIAVLPTHRRRGLLTGMMRGQLENIRDAGEAVAALWASEAAIYGRFGFGVAAQTLELSERPAQARLRTPPEPVTLRAGAAGEHVAAMRGIHDRVVPTRPGMLTRPGPWWEERLFDPESEREGATPLRAVVCDEGYALYAVKRKWDDDGPAAQVVVRELVSASPAGHAAIWAYLLDLDLTRTVTWELAPSDDPLWLALADPRALRRTLWDALWVRIVDVPAALSARTYASDPDVVIEVRDAFCPWTEGRYELSASGCAPTGREPDLVLEAAALGAAYLGGTTLLDLAGAGRVEERTPGSLARASAAFRGDVAPWCPEIF
ncbi:MAG: GNAT family N-acetyltransferase [Solirubrobacteraceae bacterium]